MSTKTLTNDDILLSKGLVEYEDPMDGAKKQVTIEVAERIAEGNSVMKKKLIKLGVITKESKKEEDK